MGWRPTAKPLARVSATLSARFKDAYMAGVIELDQFGADDAPQKAEKVVLATKLIRWVVDRAIVSPADEKPKSPFERRAMKVEIVDGLDALLSTATDRLITTPVREGCGSGGGTRTPDTRIMMTYTALKRCD